MQYRDFSKKIASGDIGGAYVMLGDEEFICKSLLDALKRSIEMDFADMNYTTLENPSAQEIVEACEMLPFFAETRIVQVMRSKYFGATKDDKELLSLLEYIPKIPRSTCLIFAGQKIDKRKAGYKELIKVLASIDCSVSNDNERIGIVCSMTRKKGGEIERAAAQQLIESVGKDLFALSHEIDKLLSITTTITTQDIKKYVTPSVESDVFRMMDAFETKRMEQGYDILEKMLIGGRRAPEIIGAIAHRFRTIAQVKEMGEKGQAKNVGKVLGSSYAIKKADAAKNRYTMKELTFYLQTLLLVDHGVKTGKVKENDGLVQLIAKIYG